MVPYIVTYLVFTSLGLQQAHNHQVSFSLIAFNFDVDMLISCCLKHYLADFFIVRLSPATVFIIVMQSLVWQLKRECKRLDQQGKSMGRKCVVTVSFEVFNVISGFGLLTIISHH